MREIPGNFGFACLGQRLVRYRQRPPPNDILRRERLGALKTHLFWKKGNVYRDKLPLPYTLKPVARSGNERSFDRPRSDYTL